MRVPSLSRFTPGLVLAALAALHAAPPTRAQEPVAVGNTWRSLFNGRDLDGWSIVLQDAEPGQDPTGVISVHDDTIHAYRPHLHGAKVPMGYIGTKEPFSNYHLRLEYRWGRKQFAPRFLYKPDAGVYYHHVTPDAIWPQALQFQVELHDTGDLLTVGAIRLETTIDPKSQRDDWQQYFPSDAGGVAHEAGGMGVSYTRRRDNHEREGWNRIDLICRADEAAQLVNGHLVNRASKIRAQDPAHPGEWSPLTGGRILLEFEATEIEYRDIAIRPLADGETLDAAIATVRVP